MNGEGFLGGSYRVGRVWGIDIKVHVLFLVWIGFELLMALEGGGDALLREGILLTVIFGSVLLHELGHCIGARWVKGDAKEIILWPLGGLAKLYTPNTAKAEFVSTAAGPAVNLILVLPLVVLIAVGHIPLPESSADLLSSRATLGASSSMLGLFCYYVAWINLLLFLFNVLPAYPMDGGRIMRSMLWPLLGWRTATLASTVTAMVFGALFVLFGVLSMAIILALIGAMVVMVSYQEFQRAKAFRPLPPYDDKMPFER